jgi:hypothetical protein
LKSEKLFGKKNQFPIEVNELIEGFPTGLHCCTAPHYILKSETIGQHSVEKNHA